MKKILLLSCATLAVHIAGPTMAADWPVLAPTYEAAPPPAVYSWWTGCYLGGNLGGAWSRAEYVLDNTVAVERFTFTPLAVIGGGQFGCQYQWNSLVFGLEGTYSWANLRQDQRVTSCLIANARSASTRSALSPQSLVMRGIGPCSMPRAGGLARD